MNTLLNQLIALAVPAAALIAYLATRVETPAARRRDEVRRTRRISRHPALANLGDVHRRLAAELPPAHAAFALDRAARHRIDARTLWAWLDRHGAEALVLALAAGHGYAGLLRVLRDEVPFDADEARLLAGLSEPELLGLVAA